MFNKGSPFSRPKAGGGEEGADYEGYCRGLFSGLGAWLAEGEFNNWLWFGEGQSQRQNNIQWHCDRRVIYLCEIVCIVHDNVTCKRVMWERSWWRGSPRIFITKQ